MPPILSCWFMFDRHVFQPIEGNITQCTEQLIKFHRMDGWCGSHARWKQGDEEIKIPMWHANHRKGDENIPDLIANIELVFSMADPVMAEVLYAKKQVEVERYKKQAYLGMKG
jgi:hypothetical protein